MNSKQVETLVIKTINNDYTFKMLFKELLETMKKEYQKDDAINDIDYNYSVKNLSVHDIFSSLDILVWECGINYKWDEIVWDVLSEDYIDIMINDLILDMKDFR